VNREAVYHTFVLLVGLILAVGQLDLSWKIRESAKVPLDNQRRLERLEFLQRDMQAWRDDDIGVLQRIALQLDTITDRITLIEARIGIVR